jgi:hypothetical protein
VPSGTLAAENEVVEDPVEKFARLLAPGDEPASIA